MPTTPQRKLASESLRHFEKADQELYQEIAQKLRSSEFDFTGGKKYEAASPKHAATIARLLNITLAKVPEHVRSSLAPEGVLLPETIVRPLARPVVTIRDNLANIEFLGPESQVWRHRIQSSRTFLDRAIPSVGRIEVGSHPEAAWLGTGWLLAPDIVVTNRHVAQEFAQRAGNKFVFRMGETGGPMSSWIDFLEEEQRVAAREYTLKSVLWMERADGADVAFLRVVRTSSEPPLSGPIALAEEIDPSDFVATIGYPARDSRIPDQDMVTRIFGDVYEKKRLAPGQLLEVDSDEIQHDCSTLGGNSGSVVLSLRTGQAVGLHFAGVFLQANYAVSAPLLRTLLRKVQSGELPGSVQLQPQATPPAPVASLVAPSPALTLVPIVLPTLGGVRIQLPEISIQIGASGAVVTNVGSPTSLPGPPTSGGTRDPWHAALAAAHESLASNPDVLAVRLGYRFKNGWITDERAIVVLLKQKRSPAELRATHTPSIPPLILGVPVDVRTGSLHLQLARSGIDLSALEAPPRPGRYREPTGLDLKPVKARMSAVFHVSPDSGFPNLRDFLQRVTRSLTGTIYEWDPNHISDTIVTRLKATDATLKMVTQRAGTEEAVKDMARRLPQQFQHVYASVGAGKLIPRAYHIKVAVRDGEEFWLSSGNWKDSNQANINPAGDNSTSMAPLRKHNREWHAIIQNQELAKLFQAYIEFDFREAKRVPEDEAVALELPDILVPEEAFVEEVERPQLAKYFDPLRINNRELHIEPLLTPDRDSRGRRVFITAAIAMVKRARKRILIQNQSFNLLRDDNVAEFEDFFEALVEQQRAGVKVRVIFRDASEFGVEAGSDQRLLLERIKDVGFDMDFVRVQRRCHTKGIIIDGVEVMLGSHNFTNQGSLYNRDASLLVRDKDVAAYFEQIFEWDWLNLATQKLDELVGGIEVARQDEVPPGYRRVSLSELLEP